MTHHKKKWAWGVALAWVALEPHAAGRLGPHAPPPDFLVVVACVLAGAGRAGSGVVPWGLGLVRDALAGGTRGVHAVGFALAAAWVRRGARCSGRSFWRAWLGLVPAVLVALAPPTVAAWAGGRPLEAVFAAAWAQAGQTLLWAPVVLLLCGVGSVRGGAGVWRPASSGPIRFCGKHETATATGSREFQ